uniref:Uncharacterized protein n=1 Tax=Salix viminalis TaxID=40686 RepID=A0A6N2LBG7_SALVM
MIFSLSSPGIDPFAILMRCNLSRITPQLFPCISLTDTSLEIYWSEAIHPEGKDDTVLPFKSSISKYLSFLMDSGSSLIMVHLKLKYLK